MRLPIALSVAGTLLLGACIYAALHPVEVGTRSAPLTYVGDVPPLLDQRCAVCRSCYNAACPSASRRSSRIMRI